MGLGSMMAGGLDRAVLELPHGEGSVSAGRLAERGGEAFAEGAGPPAVGALLTNDAASVGLVLGAVVAGARLVSLPLPPRAGDPMAYGAFVQDVCREHGIERLVARDDAAELLASVGVEAVGHSALEGEVLARPTGDGFELVQFSSGSTGRPKGIRLSDEVLGVNVAAIVDAVAPADGDVAVTWLPLSHDMGLVGMLLTSIAADLADARIVLLEPERFLVRPRLWLDAVDHWRGSFTASPDFGLRLALPRRSDPRRDLSSLRCVIVGGEIVRASTLEGFESAYVDQGLSPLALCPAYGMAEIGLAATLTRPDEQWVSCDVDPVALADGGWSPPGPDGPRTSLVASGRPLDGYGVSIADQGAGDVGTIRLAVPCAGRDAGTGLPYADAAGVITTSDRGIVADELLYVCGRADDHIVAAGRNLYAPVIEDAVADVAGVRAGRVTVVDTPEGAWVVVAERESRERPVDDERELRDRVRRAVVAAVGADPDEVALIGRGELPMTSSGKIQRHAVRQRWLVDRFRSASPGSPAP